MSAVDLEEPEKISSEFVGVQTGISPVLKQQRVVALVGMCCLWYQSDMKYDPGSPVGVTGL